MLDTLRSLLWMLLIAGAAWGVGCPLAAALLPDRQDRLGRNLWAVALGLLAYGTLWGVLGLLGLLYPPLLGLLTLLGDALAVIWLRKAGTALLQGAVATATSGAPTDSATQAVPLPPLAIGMAPLAAVVVVASLVSALAPPTAGDALCYHLQLPKEFLLDHAIRLLPYSETSTYPLLAEMWYLWALALEGPVCAQLISWLVGLLFCLAAVWFAQPMLPGRWALLAGGLVLLVPGVNVQMTAPLNDAGLALWSTLALAAVWRAVWQPDSNGRLWLLAGLAAGGALATKYTAFLAAGSAIVWLLSPAVHRRVPPGKLLAGILVATVVAGSISGMWYLRAAWYWGNPFYPFAIPSGTKLFAGNQSHDSSDSVQTMDDKRPLAMRTADVLTGFWTTTMHPERFGGRAHQLGVVFLAVLPGLLVARWPWWVFPLLAFCATYWVIWIVLQQYVRFFLPAVPPLAVLAVLVLQTIGRMPRTARFLSASIVLLMLLGNVAIATVRAVPHAAVALGLESRSQYLVRSEPTWPAASILADSAGPEARLLSQDYRAFYFPCHVVREIVFRRRVAYQKAVSAPGELSLVLRRLGFTHVLLVENEGEQGIQFDPLLSDLVDRQLASPQAERLVLLTEYRFRDGDGAVRRYRLFQLR